ncbi:hypothetical protein SISSUDRAFT_219633 [Sistotremastrum suecicum HHB10207 ss-3]|uniref:Uncharacterized protein n=1 Tax=Sistotremastrum suecicum HHB10207 ss-3 TaxID=1314776 RepID=A0A166A618_9AGAM|nr:hypothetical protein SISSUDRAFT_219633 [Sistotremastrum suecicum HHB10207 ss-3]
MSSPYQTLSHRAPSPASNSSDDEDLEYTVVNTSDDSIKNDMPCRKRLISLSILVLSLLMNLTLVVFKRPAVLRGTSMQPSPSAQVVDPWWDTPDLVYSPAQDAVGYSTRVFDTLGVLGKYHAPPDDETDALWAALYKHDLARIGKDEADKLLNWTSPVPHGDGGQHEYLIGLNVFHELRCLDFIRKSLRPERYGLQRTTSLHTHHRLPRHSDSSSTHKHNHNQDLELDPEGDLVDGADYCINLLREHIVCHADTTPNVFQWSVDKKMIFPKFDSLHVCRDWDAIVEWSASEVRRIHDVDGMPVVVDFL